MSNSQTIGMYMRNIFLSICGVVACVCEAAIDAEVREAWEAGKGSENIVWLLCLVRWSFRNIHHIEDGEAYHEVCKFNIQS